jgi:hypothetical protein
MEPINKSRFFSDFYDSVRQRGFPIVQAKFSEISNLYIARLRFDVLLSKTIVLTDAQLLDGAFILSSDPLELKNRIARSDGELMPIEVRSRTENLSDALLAFVKNPEKEKLKGFTFSSVENEEERKSLKERLESTTIGEVNEWKDILKIMKSSNVNNENIERIGEGWAKWIEAQEKGIVVVKKWEGKFDIDASLNSFLKPELTTSEGEDMANWIYEKRNDRNSIDIKLNELKKNFELSNNLTALQDILSIKSWFYSAYNHALSQQHNCRSFESIFGMSLASTQPAESEKLNLPEYFWDKLATMTNSKFKDLYWQKSSYFQNWWNNTNLNDLKRGIEPLIAEIVKTEKILDTSPLSRIFYGAASSLIGALIGEIIAGFPGMLYGAAAGGALPPALESLTTYIYYLPVRKIFQRIMNVAEMRRI